MVGPLLSVRNLVRRYGGRTVLDVDSLELEPGEVLAVVGPNGAGKSTLFRLLLLLEPADAGTIRLVGSVVRPGDASARTRIAGVFQRPILFAGTVRSNIAYAARSTPGTRSARARRVREALAWFELTALADVPVHALSGGEAQRVALARALVLEPDVLCLDEPTANLDVTIRRQFRRDLERVAREHARGIILITHDPADAFGLADRIVVLHHGRVVQTAVPAEILLRPGSPFVAELSGAELLLHGVVESIDDALCSVRIAPDVLLWATASAHAPPVAGRPAVVAYRPEAIVLVPPGEPAETSAINRIPVRIDAAVPAGALTRVLLTCLAEGGPSLSALLTRRSMAALRFGLGSPAVAQLKATALHAWRREFLT